MIEKYFAPGEKIELYSATKVMDKAELLKKTYISQITQILGEDKVEVLMPVKASKMILLPQNAIYNMTTYSSNGGYQCEVKVTERYKRANNYYQVLELTSDIKKSQRREYFRHDCSMPITSRQLEDHEKDGMGWDENLVGQDATAIDIGGGGMRFLTIENYEKDELIVCCFSLKFKTGPYNIQTLCRVVNIRPMMDEQGNNEVRVQFEHISVEDREQIIQYIFEEERRRRKNTSWRKGEK